GFQCGLEGNFRYDHRLGPYHPKNHQQIAGPKIGACQSIGIAGRHNTLFGIYGEIPHLGQSHPPVLYRLLSGHHPTIPEQNTKKHSLNRYLPYGKPLHFLRPQSCTRNDKILKMNKTIFITGVSSGLGKATAKLFAKGGWTVIGTIRRPEKEPELTEFPNVHLLKLYLTDKKEIALIAERAEKISPIDVLANNAAYGLMGPFEGTTDEQLVEQINTNFLGTLLVTKAFLPFFRKRKKGTIITITSSTANIPYPFVAVYAATKSALETWTEGMAYELNGFDIRIKTVVPAYMQTNFGRNAQLVSHPDYQDIFEGYLTTMKGDSSTKRDTPESIADVVHRRSEERRVGKECRCRGSLYACREEKI